MPSILQKNDGAHETNVVGIILAAGESSRFGQIKQLAEYSGKTFIENVVETALQSALSSLVVVIGANRQLINPILEKYNDKVIIVENTAWKNGQSSSIRVAINSIENLYAAAALFLLVDQPQIQLALINALIEQYCQKSPQILAPFFGERRGNPVLFDQTCFASLSQLQGDQGGRGIFAEFSVSRLEWQDDSILLDVDSSKDYKKLLNHEK
jgi:molybdenum cofactor cytidylyltransferase